MTGSRRKRWSGKEMKKEQQKGANRSPAGKGREGNYIGEIVESLRHGYTVSLSRNPLPEYPRKRRGEKRRRTSREPGRF